MTQLANRRDIIHRRQFMRDVFDPISIDVAAQAKSRAKVLTAMKKALKSGRDELHRRWEAGEPGYKIAEGQSHLMDQLLRLIIHFYRSKVAPIDEVELAARDMLPKGALRRRLAKFVKSDADNRLAIVAVGGYGRQQMAPFSDVDLLFLHGEEMTPWVEGAVEYILYMLWDMGLKVGHATRSVPDCIRAAREDQTIATAIVESRSVAGDQSLFDELARDFADQYMARHSTSFMEAKLEERDSRHKRQGESRYMVEPNIKEGKGGLRDLHTLFWIAKCVYRVHWVRDLVDQKVFSKDEYLRFQKAERFIWAVRVASHYLTNRAEEKLSFDLQPQIAALLGYTDHKGTLASERLMKHYFLHAKDIGDLTRILCASLEDRHQKFSLKRTFDMMRSQDVEGFRGQAGRITLQDDDVLEKDAVKMLDLFRVAQEHNFDIHPDSLRLIKKRLPLVNAAFRKDKQANKLFIDMLTSKKDPETTLRRLNEAGILGRFIPDFGRIVAQMQHDMYHHFTVDEHTLRAVGVMADIESGTLKDELPTACDVIHNIQHRTVLYVAIFLHDIAKGRGGDHSVLGAEVARKLCPRLGLDKGETELVAWLVDKHLLMSVVAMRRDLDDPKTIEDFAAEVTTLERLRLLHVLTCADIRAVGPGTWNGWKAQLLRDLYHKTEELLSGGHSNARAQYRGQSVMMQDRDAWPKDKLEEFDRVAEMLPEAWWAQTPPEIRQHQLSILGKFDPDSNDLLIDCFANDLRRCTDVTLLVPDRHGLSADLVGTISSMGGQILDAKIHTTKNGWVLDTFQIVGSNDDQVDDPAKLARLSDRLRKAATDGFDGSSAQMEEAGIKNRKREGSFHVNPTVMISNSASRTYTVIEISGRDRRGLLYDLTSALSKLNLQINSAHISTFGQQAVDVFYVKDKFGMKVNSRELFTRIRARLTEVLETGEERAQRPETLETRRINPGTQTAAE